MSNTRDGVRLAAAVLVEEVAALATVLAERLRSDAKLAPAAVAALMVEAGKVQGRLEKHQARLGAGCQEKEGAR
jgi:hypothetical protein